MCAYDSAFRRTTECAGVATNPYPLYLLILSASAESPTVSTSRIVAIALIEGSSVVRILPQTKVESELPPPNR